MPVDLGAELYVYRTLFDGNKRIQSAWGKYTFPSAERIADIGVIDGRCYMLCENDSTFFVNSFPISGEPALQWQAYPIRLDNRVSVQGIYLGDITVWPLDIPDDSLTHAVLPNGTFTLITGSSTIYWATGNWATCVATLGASYDMDVELSKMYRHDENGAAVLDMSMQYVKLVLNHQQSGPYSLEITQPLRALRTIPWTPPTGTLLQESGSSQFYVLGNAKDTTLNVTATGPKPVAIATGECAVTFTQLSR